MFKIICVTDRKSCREDFLTRIEKIAAAKPDRIIFRDKKSSYDYYFEFAMKVLKISDKYNVPCSVYSHFEIMGDIHMTMPMLEHFPLSDINAKRFIGASIHSVEEAVKAEKMGVNYVIAGHIFETDCKKGLAPRGLDFLHEVCNSVKIPVYAIGGINPDNIKLVAETGAGGACIMSGFMACENPHEYMNQLRKAVAEFEV
ncbi:MAG: thiamine phosphate synthase [Ruminococcus flavefaciens]|nr:thiamine phosphate synthase [Ruminococcus flavefaciens]